MTGPEGEDRLTGPLPEPARTRVVALASEALALLPAEEVPSTLRAVRSFTPGKRARLAATPLAAAVESDRSFRLRVAARVREALPELTGALDAGTPPAAADPADVAAVAYLLRPDGWPELVAAAAQEIDRARSDASSAAAQADVARLEAAVTQARDESHRELTRLRTELAAAKAEISDLRHKLHAAREGRRGAEAAAVQAEERLQAVQAQAATAGAAADTELRRLRNRLTRAQTDLETARRTARDGRGMADTRLRLLLDTVLESAQGLRRELALPPAAPDAVRPADLVPAASPQVAEVPAVPGQGRAADDPALLDELLRLPQAHLVVDGYNVTKLGYGTLPLQAQRERLIGGLAGLAARSGAEVTCCFDGAAVDTPVGAGGRRGVRVLFSLPGETADELIRRLVAEEPPGRPVIVVSSDREVAEGVRRSGARPVPSAMLLRRLDRG